MNQSLSSEDIERASFRQLDGFIEPIQVQG